MARVFICQDLKCDSDHAYCHTCYKGVCEKGEADVHRSIGHEVQPRTKPTSRLESNSFGHPEAIAKLQKTPRSWFSILWERSGM
jgi:hypothetical protein